MSRLEALQALAEEVEAGSFRFNGWETYPIDRKNMGRFDDAFNGSPNAVKALHEAVLPEWEWRMSSRGAAAVWTTPSTLQVAEIEDKPERALLLAILKALIAQEQAKGDE